MAQTAIMAVLSDINRPLSGCLYAARAHTGIKSLSREHEGTLTQTELAITMQIPLLGVSVLPAFGPKIASTATIHNINLFLFTCCFPLIFQYMYRSQNQSIFYISAMRLAAGSIMSFGSLLAWREGAMHLALEVVE